MIFASLVMFQHPMKVTPHVESPLMHADRFEAETRVWWFSELQKHFICFWKKTAGFNLKSLSLFVFKWLFSSLFCSLFYGNGHLFMVHTHTHISFGILLMPKCGHQTRSLTLKQPFEAKMSSVHQHILVLTIQRVLEHKRTHTSTEELERRSWSVHCFKFDLPQVMLVFLS